MFIGVVKGDTSNVSGTTINGNITLGVISITPMFNIDTGELMGGTIGFGPSFTIIGGSITGSFTGKYTIRDLINDIKEIRDLLNNSVGKPTNTNSNQCD